MLTDISWTVILFASKYTIQKYDIDDHNDIVSVFKQYISIYLLATIWVAISTQNHLLSVKRNTDTTVTHYLIRGWITNSITYTFRNINLWEGIRIK